MAHTQTSQQTSLQAPDQPELVQVREWVAHAAHYLPAQGPITAFVHHNTLHAFEDLPFEQALEKATRLYGCQTYLSEAAYRKALERGRIQTRDLEAVLQQALEQQADQEIAGLVRRDQLWLTMMLEQMELASEAEIQWLMAAGEGMRSFQKRCPVGLRRQMVSDTRQWLMRKLRGERQPDTHRHQMSEDLFARWGVERIESWSSATWDEVTLTLLWRVCRAGVHGIGRFQPPAEGPVRLRDQLLARHLPDPDLLVHEVLIRFCAAFTDQGLAAWHLPQQDLGFYRAFLALYGQGYPARAPWLVRVSAELARLQAQDISPEALILESLQAFGVESHEREDFLLQSLLALRGWAGMLWQLESRPDRIQHPIPTGSLLAFLAIRLLLDRCATEYICQQQKLTGGLAQLRQQGRKQLSGHLPAVNDSHLTPSQRAYGVFLLAQSLGWSPQRLDELSPAQWQSLIFEVERFSSFERRRLFQRAYERRFAVQVLDPLAAYQPPVPAATRPAAQVIFCIDEREESYRRHLEELAPEVETFGIAGFFGVAMYYQGIWDVHEMPLCPVIVRPRHRVREQATGEAQASHARGVSTRRQMGLATHGWQTGSHGFFSGLATTLLGSLAAVPLVAQVLFPRFTARLRQRARHLVQAPFQTELTLERSPAEQPDNAGIYTGYLPSEMAGIVAGALRNIGLTSGLAPLVVVVGHGSSSLNNPHEAAHDCGACGGGRGGPNARAFAQMANHPQVRQLLAEQGLEIPADTWFIGAYHNTCDESVSYYDLEHVPTAFQSQLTQTRSWLQAACERNAHERARRFYAADVLISPEEALHHVEARAEDLAQPRPEYGHATNAICIVGRRQRTRGLFLDRRAFLVSYDPLQDNETSSILAGILGAVIPVCSGINLEYYFSYVDNTGWGCGTKLPHNITALLGVMDGAASDLRPGLPWQMVEIHEPVRLLMLVETTPERLKKIIDSSEGLSQICYNSWIVLGCLDPDSQQIQLLEAGQFKPYQPEKNELPGTWPSVRWYGGLREHLELAAIVPPSANERSNKQ